MTTTTDQTKATRFGIRSDSPTAFRRWRDRLGLTQGAAAKALGISEKQVQRYDYAMGAGRDRAAQAPDRRTRLAMAAIAAGLEPEPGDNGQV